METLARKKKINVKNLSRDKTSKDASTFQKSSRGRGRPARARNPAKKFISSPPASKNRQKGLTKKSSLKDPVVNEPSVSSKPPSTKLPSNDKIVRFTEPEHNSPTSSVIPPYNNNFDLLEDFPANGFPDEKKNELKATQSGKRRFGLKKNFVSLDSSIETINSHDVSKNKSAEAHSFDKIASQKPFINTNASGTSNDFPKSNSSKSLSGSDKENKVPLRKEKVKF
jgi:hypothetical protein